MNKSSSRALIFNQENEVYLVTHHYINPNNDGKWSTIGGRREIADKDNLDCLKREIAEEFGNSVLSDLDFLEKAGEFQRVCEINYSDSVTHHFYYCRLRQGATISPGSHQHEVKEGRFFSLKEVLEIEKNNGFVLGREANMIESFLNESSVKLC